MIFLFSMELSLLLKFLLYNLSLLFKSFRNLFLFKDEASVDGFIVQFLLIEVLESDYSPALSLNS